MDFLPAIPLFSLRGYGGIAINVDGSLLASVDSDQHCVYIYSVDGAGECLADPVVVGTRGKADGEYRSPRFACFVRRGGRDTLLICDRGNHRVVEVTANGAFLRAIAMPYGSHPWGIAYCVTSDVIAVSLFTSARGGAAAV